ncbi:hypothetical protein DFJ73DRAFT_823866 [Zopfochytrium polystomum]|nr:hypothetical protein DFJ73DRAFT_823866 [Zopfochytrium polystomum]
MASDELVTFFLRQQVAASPDAPAPLFSSPNPETPGGTQSLASASPAVPISVSSHHRHGGQRMTHHHHHTQHHQSKRLGRSNSHNRSHTHSPHVGDPGLAIPPELLAMVTPTQPGLNRRWSCEICRKRKLKCDGNRPSCGFCAKKNFHCVYLGTKTRAEHELEIKYKAEMERRKAKSDEMSMKRASLLMPPTPSGQLPDNLQVATGPERPPETFAPLDIPLGNLSVEAIDAAAPQTSSFEPRPDAPEGEESILIDNFFGIHPSISMVLHKRTYLRSYKLMPSYLRLAVCAAGANIPLKTNLTEEESLWYIRKAVQELNIAMQKPKFECLQALMILTLTASCMGENQASTVNLDGATNLALYLGLNIDPDYLPALAGLSWPEKEARRRCWWLCFIGDHVISTLTYGRPALSRSIASVKPVCPEHLWSSPKPPEALQKDYDSPRSANDNPLNWFIELLELFSRVVSISRPTDLVTTGIDHVIIAEKQLESELLAWWNKIPASFWARSEDSLYETMEEDPHIWRSNIELHFGYHGSTCLLMRRRALLHLRNLSSPISPDMAGKPSLDGPAPAQLENELALNKAIASAVAMANMIELLNRSNAFIHRLPFFILIFCIQGAMVLLVAEYICTADVGGKADALSVQVGLSGRKIMPSPDARSQSPMSQNAGAQGSPSSTENLKRLRNLSKHVDEFFSLLNVMSATRKMVAPMHKLLKRARMGDWKYLDEVQGNPIMLLNEINYAKSPQLPVQEVADSPSLSGSPSMASKIHDLNIPSVSPWEHFVAMFSAHINELVSALREAKEIGDSLTPSSTPPPSTSALDANLLFPSEDVTTRVNSFLSPSPGLEGLNSRGLGGNATLAESGAFNSSLFSGLNSGFSPNLGWGSNTLGVSFLVSQPSLAGSISPFDGILYPEVQGQLSADSNNSRDDAMVLLDWLMTTGNLTQ